MRGGIKRLVSAHPHAERPFFFAKLYDKIEQIIGMTINKSSFSPIPYIVPSLSKFLSCIYKSLSIIV